jgi:CBS domain-containing protein
MADQSDERYVVGATKQDYALIHRQESLHEMPPPNNTRDILQRTKVGELVSESKKIVQVLAKETLKSTMEKLVENKVSSLPIYSPPKHKFVGFIDYLDLLTHVQRELTAVELNSNKKTLVDTLADPKFEHTSVEMVAGKSKHPHPYLPVDQNAPLVRAIEIMLKNRVARVPVIDSDGNLLTILTESGIVQFLRRNLHQIKEAHQTVASLRLTNTAVQPVLPTDKAQKAFSIMHELGLMSLPVVAEDNVLVGNISASDLKVIGSEASLLVTLELPIQLFLKLTSDKGGQRPPIHVRETDTLQHVITTFVDSRVHNIWVVEDNMHLKGVIGLRDVLLALLLAHS